MPTGLPTLRARPPSSISLVIMIIYCYNDSVANALSPASPKGRRKLLPNFKVASPGWPWWNGPINLPAAFGSAFTTSGMIIFISRGWFSGGILVSFGGRVINRAFDDDDDDAMEEDFNLVDL